MLHVRKPVRRPSSQFAECVDSEDGSGGQLLRQGQHSVIGGASAFHGLPVFRAPGAQGLKLPHDRGQLPPQLSLAHGTRVRLGHRCSGLQGSTVPPQPPEFNALAHRTTSAGPSPLPRSNYLGGGTGLMPVRRFLRSSHSEANQLFKLIKINFRANKGSLQKVTILV